GRRPDPVRRRGAQAPRTLSRSALVGRAWAPAREARRAFGGEREAARRVIRGPRRRRTEGACHTPHQPLLEAGTSHHAHRSRARRGGARADVAEDLLLLAPPREPARGAAARPRGGARTARDNPRERGARGVPRGRAPSGHAPRARRRAPVADGPR